MTSSPTDIPMDASIETSEPAPSIPTPTTDTELYSSDEDLGANTIGGGGGSAFETPSSSQQSNPSQNAESFSKGVSWSDTSARGSKGFVTEGEGRRGQTDEGNSQNDGKTTAQKETTGEGESSGPDGGAYAPGGLKEDRLLGEEEFEALNEEIGDPFDTDTDEVDTSQQS